MSPADKQPDLDDVLEAFTFEPSHDKATLGRYLATYPQFAGELMDLTRELARHRPDVLRPLSATDSELVDRSWRQFNNQPAADLLSDMPVAEQRRLARALDVPRQVITALRERRVRPESIKRPFLERVAALLNQETDRLTALLSNSAPAGLARAYKSDTKPDSSGQVSFEELLIEAGVPKERMAELLAEGD